MSRVFISKLFSSFYILPFSFSVIHITQHYGFILSMCEGPSMRPTFNHENDIVLAEYLSVYFQRLKRGNIVTAISPNNPETHVVKRICGMPGDRLEIVDVDLYGNRVKRKVSVPRGHVWLQGDNYRNSTDSRHYGPVPLALIEGRVLCRVYPFTQFRWVASKKHRNPTVRRIGTSSDEF